jgi:hypothetical protein
MTEPKPPKKRLVTPKEYLRLGVSKIGWTLLLLLMLFGLPLLMVLERYINLPLGYYGSMLLFPLALIVAMVVIPRIGEQVALRVLEREDVELLTSDTANRLPAEETLVRASTEPTQAQEKVLLRAATGAEETPPEQLLRADVSPAP